LFDHLHNEGCSIISTGTCTFSTPMTEAEIDTLVGAFKSRVPSGRYKMITENRDRFDKKLKKTLAAAAKPRLNPALRNSLGERLRSLANEAAEFGVSEAVNELSRFLLSRDRQIELRQSPGFPTERALELAQSGLTATFEFAVYDSPEAFAELPVDALLRQISSTALLTKIAGRRKGLLIEALTEIRREPSAAFQLPGLPWVIAKAKLPDLLPLLPFLFGERHEAATSQLATMRAQFIRRDKTGRSITEILGRISAGELSDEALVDTLQRSPEAAAVFVQLLPKLISRHSSDQAAKVFQKWLPSLPEIPKKRRTLVSGALAALCGSILLKERRQPVEDWILSLVADAIRRLALEIGADVGGYWGVLPLDASRSDNTGVYVSPEGARLLVESIEKLEDSRYEATNVIEALASNLGLSKTDEPSTVVMYDPKIHQDIVGGLLKQQTAVVVRSGWRYNETVLLKAKVKPKNEL
jgi:hypothetical protein